MMILTPFGIVLLSWKIYISFRQTATRAQAFYGSEIYIFQNVTINIYTFT